MLSALWLKISYPLPTATVLSSTNLTLSTDENKISDSTCIFEVPLYITTLYPSESIKSFLSQLFAFPPSIEANSASKSYPAASASAIVPQKISVPLNAEYSLDDP